MKSKNIFFFLFMILLMISCNDKKNNHNDKCSHADPCFGPYYNSLFACDVLSTYFANNTKLRGFYEKDKKNCISFFVVYDEKIRDHIIRVLVYSDYPEDVLINELRDFSDQLVIPYFLDILFFKSANKIQENHKIVTIFDKNDLLNVHRVGTSGFLLKKSGNMGLYGPSIVEKEQDNKIYCLQKEL